MWTVVFMAQSKSYAETLRDALYNEGILSKIRPVGKECVDTQPCYEVLVPAAEVEAAHNIIIDIGF